MSYACNGELLLFCWKGYKIYFSYTDGKTYSYMETQKFKLPCGVPSHVSIEGCFRKKFVVFVYSVDHKKYYFIGTIDNWKKLHTPDENVDEMLIGKRIIIARVGKKIFATRDLKKWKNINITIGQLYHFDGHKLFYNSVPHNAMVYQRLTDKKNLIFGPVVEKGPKIKYPFPEKVSFPGHKVTVKEDHLNKTVSVDGKETRMWSCCHVCRFYNQLVVFNSTTISKVLLTLPWKPKYHRYFRKSVQDRIMLLMTFLPLSCIQ